MRLSLFSRSTDSLARDAFNDFMLSRKAVLLSPRTLEFYDQTLSTFLEWLGPKELTANRVRSFLAEMSNRRSDATVAKYARAIRAFCWFCAQEGHIPRPIRVRIPKVAEKRPPVLNTEQVSRLLTAARRLRDRVVVLLLVDTGLRASEALDLQWSDVDFEASTIRVRRGKGGKSRTVVIGDLTANALRKCKDLSRSDGRVLLTHSGRQLKYWGLRRLLDRLGNRAGVKCNPHTLRRTFATLCLKQGMPTSTPRRLMGHSQIATTELYLRLVDEDLIEAHTRWNPLKGV